MATRNGDNRAAVRVPTKIVISYRTLDDFFMDYATNISLGGIRVETSSPLPVSTVVTLNFVLPHAGYPLEAKGEVRWAVEPSTDDTGPACGAMGIRFEELSESDLEYLESLVRLAASQL